MGLDVTLFVEGDVTDEQIEAAEKLFAERSLLDTWGDSVYIQRSDYHPGRVERKTLHRYYGPGYERGDWPMIYADILLMRAAFPGMTVYYGSDCQDTWDEATDEVLAEIWQHWAGPNGWNYRR